MRGGRLEAVGGAPLMVCFRFLASAHTAALVAAGERIGVKAALVEEGVLGALEVPRVRSVELVYGAVTMQVLPGQVWAEQAGRLWYEYDIWHWH